MRLIAIEELSGFGPFSTTPEVRGAFPGSSPQTIVLVGENGVGKTTLLRCLTLALLGPAAGVRLLTGARVVTRTGEGRIRLRFDFGVADVRVLRRGSVETLETPGAGEDTLIRPWVKLFSMERWNTHAVTFFLLQAEHRRLRGRGEVWAAAREALCRLLDLQSIQVDAEDTVWAERTEGRIPFDQLGHGALTTAGWVVGLIASWLDQRKLGEDSPSGLLAQMRGCVLVDGVDLHLHPQMQSKVLRNIRTVFPNLNFVVTAINPLTLHGAGPGEVFTMSREGGRIVLTQRDVRPGDDADLILFRQFGIEATLAPEVQRLLKRRRDLIRTSPDDPGLLAVEQDLASYGITR